MSTARERVAAALAADAGRSDVMIAAECNACRALVQRARRAGDKDAAPEKRLGRDGKLRRPRTSPRRKRS